MIYSHSFIVVFEHDCDKGVLGYYTLMLRAAYINDAMEIYIRVGVRAIINTKRSRLR